MGACPSKKNGATFEDVPATKAHQPEYAAFRGTSIHSILPTSSGRDHLARDLVLITDPGQDLDDEMMFILLRCLVELKLVRVLCIICNLYPSFQRALLCRGTIDMLGMLGVPVGVGTDGGDISGKHKDVFAQTASYMLKENSHQALSLHTGRELLFTTFDAAEIGSISLCLASSMKDAALFLRDNESLFKAKIRDVTIMGGVMEPKAGCLLEPDTGHNNEFDREAAEFLYRRCQELGVPMIVVGRHSAYACPVSRQVYDDLGNSGSPIGWRLRVAQCDSIESLWRRAASKDDEVRMGLPARCNIAWFKATFCGNDPLLDGRGPNDVVWDLVKNFNMYDSIALIATIPSLRRSLFSPVEHVCHDTAHHLIGCSETHTGLSPAQVELCSDFLHSAYKVGISLDHHNKTLVVLSMSAMPAASAFLGLVLLRSLVSCGAVELRGIVVSSNCRFCAFSEPALRAEEIRTFLAGIGLQRVPVMVQHTSVQENCLEKMYKDAPDTGIHLLITHDLGDAASFAMLCPALFRNKTTSVALLEEIEVKGGIMKPALEQKKAEFDPYGAHYFFRRCQELGVPLCVVSKSLQRSLALPRSVVDTLETMGGANGQLVSDDVNKALGWLSEQAALPIGHRRRSLSPSCDLAWFEKSFNVDGAISPTNGARHLRVDLPLLALATVPKIREHFFQSEEWTTRGATHRFVSAVAGGKEAGQIGEELRHFIVQHIFKGVYVDQGGSFDAAPCAVHVPEVGFVDCARDGVPAFMVASNDLQAEMLRMEAALDLR